MNEENSTISSVLTIRSGLVIALAGSLSIGYLDLILSCLFGKSTFTSFYQWSAAVAFTSIVFFGVSSAILVTGKIISKLASLDSLAIGLAAMVGLFFAFSLFSINNLFNRILTNQQKSLAVFFLFLGFLFSAGIYFLFRRINRAGRLEFFNRSAIALLIVVILFVGQLCLGAAFLQIEKLPGDVKGTFAADNHPVKKVILITVDTLRADSLSCTSKTAPNTPSIDGLAGDGISFSRAFAPTSWTLPSFASMLTGVSPAIHQANKEHSLVPMALTTVAERFDEAGYLTAAIGTNPVMLNVNLDQGIRDYTWFPRGEFRYSFGGKLIKKLFSKRYPLDANAAGISDLSLKWLAKHKDDAFFLWIHYLDPHHPFEPPPRFVDGATLLPSIGYRFDKLYSVRRGYFTPTPKEIAWIRELYNGEVKFVDAGISRVLDALKQQGLYEDSLIVLAGDHGEEFWEHGGFEHGHTMYNELIHVPIIVKLPGTAQAGLKIDRNVSLESVASTLLDICGLPETNKDLAAQSLVPLWDEGQGTFTDKPIISRANLYYEQQESVINENDKLIRYHLSGKKEQFDLEKDFSEKTNIAADESGEALEAILDTDNIKSIQLRKQYGIEEAGSSQIDPQRLEELRSLGYIQ